KLKEASGARFRLIATDGCFSMDGTIADLKSIVDLAEKYDALTMIDDAHATGFLGKTGRGTHEYRGVMGKIDIITGTLGKALGDAAKSQKFAARMLDKGVYVIGFFYPVVPHGTARVRVQVSAAHSREDLEFAVKAFAETNDELK